MRRTTATAIAAVVVCLLTGCTDGAEEPAGLSTVTDTPPATPEPTPTPTPTGPVDRSDEEVGIVFVDLPDVTGDALTAIDALTLYEVEEWRAMTTGVLDPSIAFFVSQEVMEIVQAQLDGNAESGWTIDGVLVTTVDIVDADAHTAHATVCRDGVDALYTNAGVTYSAGDVGLTERAFFNVVRVCCTNR